MVDYSAYDDPFLINYGLNRIDGDDFGYDMKEIYNMALRIVSKEHHIKYAVQTLGGGTHICYITDLVFRMKTINELSAL